MREKVALFRLQQKVYPEYNSPLWFTERTLNCRKSTNFIQNQTRKIVWIDFSKAVKW